MNFLRGHNYSTNLCGMRFNVAIIPKTVAKGRKFYTMPVFKWPAVFGWKTPTDLPWLENTGVMYINRVTLEK
jgi:hypothetical protein